MILATSIVWPSHFTFPHMNVANPYKKFGVYVCLQIYIALEVTQHPFELRVASAVSPFKNDPRNKHRMAISLYLSTHECC
eukprot:c31411_g1_i1 orf=93-332(+)